MEDAKAEVGSVPRSIESLLDFLARELALEVVELRRASAPDAGGVASRAKITSDEDR